MTAQTPSLDELSKKLEMENDDSGFVTTAIDLSKKIHREGHDEAAEYRIAKLAVSRALASENTVLYAKALDNLGLLYRYHEWYAQAVPLHTKAFDLVEEMDINPVTKMIFANNAGLAARYDQQYDLSVNYYLKALKIAETTENLKNIAISSNGLGNTLSNIPGKEEEALQYFQNALKVEEKRNESLGIAMNLLSISKLYIDKRDFDESFRLLSRLKQVNEQRQDVFGMAVTNETYGDVYAMQNNYSEASRYYLMALKEYKVAKKPLNQAQVLNSLGEIMGKAGNPEKSIFYLERSAQLADSLKSKSLMMVNAFHISDLKENQGDYTSALQYYKLGKAYEDSIDLDNQKIKIIALNNQYEWDKKELEINNLQNEQFLSERKIENQRLFTTSLIIALGLGLLTFYIHYRNRRNKRIAKEKLMLKERQLLKAEYEKNLAQAEILVSRLQINPHFMFNCLTAIKLMIQKNENKKADKYLTTFSRFVRMVLELPKNETISVAEELELIKYYLILEEKRFDQNFNFQIETCPKIDLENIKIPPLLLQPFVENAIWHGLLPSQNSNKNLKISIEKNNNLTQISIDDNGVGRAYSQKTSENNPTKKKSLGMKITKERIQQFNQSFKNDCQILLHIIDRENSGGTKVVLTLENLVQPN
ncbi:MAG: histidine kinase [Weeksellaceae bacterium]